jgi:NAD(P)-dependent dehydrogenase (short-subunit alcohol dehydrogenase family)
LARRFASEGLRVILAGRTAKSLKSIAAAITDAGGVALPRVTAASREKDFIALFDKAAADGDLRLVAYNVGNNVMTPLLQTEAAVFESMWRQNALGGFLVGREAVRRMLPRREGAILFTGATAPLRARPPCARLRKV